MPMLDRRYPSIDLYPHQPNEHIVSQCRDEKLVVAVVFGDILEGDVCVEDVLRLLFPVGAVVPFGGDEEE